MALVTLKEVLEPAYKGGYAVPAFNFWTLEDVQAIIRGAQEESSPVIVMASLSCLKHMGEKITAMVVKELAENVKIPVVLHIDHAEEVEVILRVMKYGFTSVMYDGSKLPIEENIANTQFVVKVARPLGVSVEAEIGRVGKGEEGEDVKQVLTDPDAALDFYNRTKVDALAIAAGTSHGMQKQEAELRYDIIEKITKKVPIPLVLHGSSGVKNEDLLRVAKTGISKINFGTRLRTAYIEKCRDVMVKDATLKNHITMIDQASKSVTEVVKEKIRFIGSAKKA